MQTNLLKCVSIAALFLAAAFWASVADYQLVLRFVVSLAAFLVARQALRARKRLWAGGFVVIAVLFNPFVSLIGLSSNLALLVVLGSAVVFGVSLTTLRPQPLFSVPSITGRTPGSESL